jgi:hypothetical protein
MVNTSLRHLAGWSAILSALATILGAVTLVMFFSLGEPFGTINDISSVVIGVTGAIILYALHQVHRGAAPVLSLTAFAIGALAALAAAAFQTVLVVARVNVGVITTYLFGVFGAALMLYGYLILVHKTLPRGPGWSGIAAGIGYVVVDMGFILSGPNHPLTYIGGIISVLAYPTWAIWLVRIFLKPA